MCVVSNWTCFGAEGGTRTPTGFPTTPSRWRVCQFHHFGTETQVRSGGSPRCKKANHSGTLTSLPEPGRPWQQPVPQVPWPVPQESSQGPVSAWLRSLAVSA
jgi:hypothetical protein